MIFLWCLRSVRGKNHDDARLSLGLGLDSCKGFLTCDTTEESMGIETSVSLMMLRLGLSIWIWIRISGKEPPVIAAPKAKGRNVQNVGKNA